MQPTALITGGTGFLGRALAKRLEQTGWRVHIISRGINGAAPNMAPQRTIFPPPQSTSAAIDIISQVKPDAVFHLASCWADPAQPGMLDAMLDVNLRLGSLLMEACASASKPPAFLNAGSFWQFGGAEEPPTTLYATMKQSFHNLLLHYRSHRQLRATTLILYDTYGPDDDRPKLWRRLIQAEPNSSFPLSRGTQMVELVHIQDVAAAFVRAADLLLEDIPLLSLYSVRSSEPRTLKETITSILKMADKRIDCRWGELDGKIIHIERPWQGPLVPGWQPRVPFEQGVREMIQSYERCAQSAMP